MTVNPSADCLFLRGLKTDCIIGFLDWERRTAQRIVFDLEMPCDCAGTAAHDDPSSTLQYQIIAQRAVQWVAASQFQLVETLAHRLALVLLAEFDFDWVRVNLKKPGALADVSEVGVRIERTRADLQAQSGAPPPLPPR